MRRVGRERVGTALQTVKTAVAATLAWETARLLTGADAPVFAPLTALLVVQITVQRSVRQALERVGGVVAGVLVALGLAQVVGLTAAGIALLVAGGLLVGRLVRLGAEGAVQVPVSALLVLIVGTGAAAGEVSDVVVARVEDTAIGAAVGVLVNLALVAPIRLRPAAAAVTALATALADQLTLLAGGVAAPFDAATARRWLLQARLLPGTLATAQDSLADARESLRFNPRRRRADDEVARLGEALVALEHSVTQVRGTSRTLFDLARVGGTVSLPGSYAPALATAGTAMAAYAASLQGAPVSSLQTCLEEARAALEQAVSVGGGRGRAWLARGSVLSDLTSVLREIDPAGPHAGALQGAAPPPVR